MTPGKLLRNWRNFHADDFNRMLTSPGRKSLGRQLAEAGILFWRYRYPPVQYLQSGLYLKDGPADWRSHMPPALVRRLQNALNPAELKIFASDKRLFRKRMEAAGLPAIREVFAIDPAGVIRDPVGKTLSPGEAAEMLREGEFFAKPIDGSLGEGVQLIRPGEDVEAFVATARNMIVQPRIRQHPLLDRLSPSAVNTVRIDTLRVGDAWKNSAAVLKLAVHGSIVDHGAHGAVIVGIDLETGKLHPQGRKRPAFGGTVHARHPDTDEPFEGVTLPHWRLLRETVARAAEAMLPLQTLGWDVAITEEGVLLVEANSSWHMTLFQSGGIGLADTLVGKMACELHAPRRRREAARMQPTRPARISAGKGSDG